MNMNRRKRMLLTVGSLLVSLALCLLLYRFDNKYTHQACQPISGVLSVAEKPMAQAALFFLTREWEFFPGVSLSPEELAHYNGYRCYTDIGGADALAHGCGTYRMTLLLPDQEATYALEIPEIFSACQLFLNGRPLLALGEPSPQGYAEGIANRILPFDAAGRTELLLRTCDFSGVYSGMTFPPTFGTAQAVGHMREIRLLLHGGAVLLALLGFALAAA
ncbi:MAG: hypothetical protein RRY21_03340, partial [Oscillospiraceae bacterium]